MINTDTHHDGTVSDAATEDDSSPPHESPAFQKVLRECADPRLRWYIYQIIQIAEDMLRHDSFIVTLDTFEKLMHDLEINLAPTCPETIRVLRAMMYEGQSPETAGSKVGRSKLSLWLRRAACDIGIRGDQGGYAAINIRTIQNSSMIHRFAEEAGVDLKDFPIKIL